MNRVLLPNLFFEEELLPTTKLASLNARQLAAELGPVMGLLGLENLASDPAFSDPSQDRSIVLVTSDARPGDVPPVLQSVEFLTIDELLFRHSELNPTHTPPSESGNATNWEVVPWGWSDFAVNAFRKTGVVFDAPDLAAVRQINGRYFQSQFDVVLEIDGNHRTNSFGILCRTLPEVEAAILSACHYSPHGWVIKAELSHACRNRLLGTSSVCSVEQRAWLAAKFASGESVYVEPWVQRVSECGLQFHVTKSASAVPQVQFIGAAEMITDESGRYRGSVVLSLRHEGSWHGSLWQPAIEHGHRIAEAAASNGFFGAIGIDCMIFRGPRDNRPFLRLSHDINGRLTMGRVALSLRRLLEPGETGFWLHSTADFLRQNQNRIDKVSGSGVRMISTSPGQIGGRVAKIGTALFVSTDREALTAIRMQIPGQSAKMPGDAKPTE